MLIFKSRRYTILLSVIILILLGIQFHKWRHNKAKHFDANGFTNEKHFIQPKSEQFMLSNSQKITLATTICHKLSDNAIREQAMVMIKSIIISSFMYSKSIIWWVELHLFMERNEDVDWFMQKLNASGYPFPNIRIDIHFRSAGNVIPTEYQDRLFNHAESRCAYVKHLLALTLTEVDTILYIDTDTIFVGDLMTLWLQKENMIEEMFIAAVGESHSENPGISSHFADIGVPPPKGISTNVLIMSLRKMREKRWPERLLRVYEDYSLHVNPMTEQKLLNILLYYNPASLLQISCQFNIRRVHCFGGLYCPEAEQDPLGVVALYGAELDPDDGLYFKAVFTAYQNIDLKGDQNLSIKSLLKLKIYKEPPSDGIMTPTEDMYCGNLLRRNLFKSYVVKH